VSIILVIIGLAVCSYQTPVHEFIGGALIAVGILHAIFGKKKPVRIPSTPIEQGSDRDGYTGRVHGDTYVGVYDRDNNYIRETDLTPTIDGKYITPNGDLVTQDSDGEYRMY